MTFDIDKKPEWVTQVTHDSARLCAPAVGDLWTLSWGGCYEGTVLLTQVYAHHVVAAPITNVVASSTEISLTRNGIELSLWPQAETGLGTFLLHEQIGTALTSTQVLEIRRWQAQVGPLSSVSPGIGERDGAVFEEILARFQRLCFIEWPSDAEAVLDLDAVALEPSQFAQTTGISTPRVLDLWSGLPLQEEELTALGANADEWVTVSHDSVTAELSSPEVKDLFAELASLLGGDERLARNNARSAFALAARTDSAPRRNATRIADTVRTLIEEARASDN
ncbi:hypothetical protein [Microbacterium sp. P04]|uniref:hypothetical protein n=1 Tax=Microbacterium sp. P04 TaxID=3366947 RepID=UPI003747755F